jgi:hypothetical protein
LRVLTSLREGSRGVRGDIKALNSINGDLIRLGINARQGMCARGVQTGQGHAGLKLERQPRGNAATFVLWSRRFDRSFRCALFRWCDRATFVGHPLSRILACHSQPSRGRPEAGSASLSCAKQSDSRLSHPARKLGNARSLRRRRFSLSEILKFRDMLRIQTIPLSRHNYSCDASQ